VSSDAPRPMTRREARLLLMASAVIGISAAVFLVTVLRRLEVLPPFMPLPFAEGWYFEGYELPAALLGVAGIWLLCPVRGWTGGLVGAASALAAMLLADTFRAMSYFQPMEWGEAPRWVCRQFAWGGWPKLLRYAFGIYLAGHLCASGRVRSRKTRGRVTGGES